MKRLVIYDEFIAAIAFGLIILVMIILYASGFQFFENNNPIVIGNTEYSSINDNSFDFKYADKLLEEKDEKRIKDYCKGKHEFTGTVVSKRGSRQRFVEWNIDRRYDYIIDIHPEGLDDYKNYTVYVNQSTYDNLNVGDAFTGYGTANVALMSEIVIDCNHLF